MSREEGNPQRARLTAPYPLSIKTSSIKNAGEGVWTEADLPEGLIFGPYEGVFTKENPEKDSGYGWKVIFIEISYFLVLFPRYVLLRKRMLVVLLPKFF